MIVSENALKISIWLITLPNENAMKKFYRLWWFPKVERLVEIFEIFGNSEK